jgi:hypothetical protein
MHETASDGKRNGPESMGETIHLSEKEERNG